MCQLPGNARAERQGGNHEGCLGLAQQASSRVSSQQQATREHHDGNVSAGAAPAACDQDGGGGRELGVDPLQHGPCVHGALVPHGEGGGVGGGVVPPVHISCAVGHEDMVVPTERGHRQAREGEAGGGEERAGVD